MDLNKVKFNDGRPYVEYERKSGQRAGELRKCYGQIIICKNCGKKCFTRNGKIRAGEGKLCMQKCKQGKNNPNWKGGRKRSGDGYILIHSPKHPFCNSCGYVFEHRLIIERQIGRYLTAEEVGHHINRSRDDNHLQNLMAFKNKSLHTKFENGKNICFEDIIFDRRKNEF